jgi:hypothetical protein
MPNARAYHAVEHPTPPGAAGGLPPPSAPEAEAAVLGAIIMEPDRILPLCDAAGISEDSFYESRHRLVFNAVVRLREDGTPVDVNTVQAAIRQAGHLDDIGGGAFLDRLVDGCIPAHVEHYLNMIVEARDKRRLLAVAQRLEQAARNGMESATIIADTESALREIGGVAANQFPAYRFSDLLNYVPDVSNHVAGDGWLRGGAGTLLVGGTGLGKSVLAQQIAVCVAAGTRFFGIQIREPQPVLYIGAENDAETMQRDFSGIVKNMEPNPCPVVVEANLRVVHCYGMDGEFFARFLADELRRNRPKLVVVDPYQAFLGGGEMNSSETFLRWIRPIDAAIKQFNVALLLVAHTPKPRDRENWTARESVYMAAGSSVISNWARTSCELTECGDGDGRFRLRFSKNAERAGMVDEHGHIVRDLYLVHSGNRHEPCWLLADRQATPSASPYAEAIRLAYEENPSASIRDVAAKVGCGKSTVERWKEANQHAA